MHTNLKQTILALALAPALALPALAQPGRQAAQAPRAQAQVDLQHVYRSGWSAAEMLGTEVRGERGEAIGDVKDIIVDRFGNVSSVVVEVGGFFEVGDQHIAVPWKDIAFGQDLEWIQVPLREVRSGTYSLHGAMPAPQGEDVASLASSWRVNELIGDEARLRDVRRYGYVSDVVFDNRGRAQAIVVRRGPGAWGTAGAYAYPYGGYYAHEYAYPLPYGTGELARFGEFDYVELGRQSRYSGADRRAGAGSSARTAR